MAVKTKYDKLWTESFTTRLRKKFALLVDREEICRALLSSLLAERGYAVKSCKSIWEAAELIESMPFDIVIIDHASPVFDGLSLLQTIKDKNRRTPVLILSSHYSDIEHLQAADLGALDYLNKPLDYSEFQKVVETYCRM